MQITKAGGKVILFPEGKSSISGTNQPITPGTGKLVKKLGIPVYTTQLTGGFFNGYYYEFQPEHKVITKWLMAIEECHRLAGGVWQNNIPQQQWIYEDDKPTDKDEYYL